MLHGFGGLWSIHLVYIPFDLLHGSFHRPLATSPQDKQLTLDKDLQELGESDDIVPWAMRHGFFPVSGESDVEIHPFCELNVAPFFFAFYSHKPHCREWHLQTRKNIGIRDYQRTLAASQLTNHPGCFTVEQRSVVSSAISRIIFSTRIQSKFAKKVRATTIYTPFWRSR